MRPSSIELVKRISQQIDLKQDAVDIGGGGFSGVFSEAIDCKTLDIENADIIADITKMPEVKDNSFNTIICTDTLEHVNDPFKAASEIVRVLNHGGVLILTTVLIWDFHQYPNDYFRFTVPALEFLFKDLEKIESGWQEEDVPFDDFRITLERSGVYFVGRKP